MDEAKNQINDLEHRKQSKHTNNNNNKSPIRTTRIKKLQKMRIGEAASGTTSRGPNIHIIGVPEGEKKEQETKNLFEKIMKANFPNVVKEIGI